MKMKYMVQAKASWYECLHLMREVARLAVTEGEKNTDYRIAVSPSVCVADSSLAEGAIVTVILVPILSTQLSSAFRAFRSGADRYGVGIRPLRSACLFCYFLGQAKK